MPAAGVILSLLSPVPLQICGRSLCRYAALSTATAGAPLPTAMRYHDTAAGDCPRPGGSDPVHRGCNDGDIASR